LSELEGVQVAAARVDESSEIPLAAHMRLQFVATQQSRRWIVVFLVQLAGPIVQFLEMPRFDGDVDMVCVVVAIDGVFADQGLGEIQRLDGQVEQMPCVIPANFRGQCLLTRGKAKNGLSAAAPGSSVPDGTCLEQGDAVAAFRQVQCRRAARDAAAQYHHVRAVFAAQCLAMGPRTVGDKGCRGGYGGRVVRGGGWIG
jgi:hypothetical protein